MRFLLTLIAALGLFTSCLPDSLEKWDKEEPTASSDAAQGSSGGDVTESTSCSDPLCVTVSTRWGTEDNGEVTTQGTCTGYAGSNLCEITIPEGQLYFSDLVVNIDTVDSTTCSVVSFRPYYYKMSNSATFTNKSCATTDCSAVPEDATCFSGPATEITGFPGVTGQYILPGNGVISVQYSFKSPNEVATETEGCVGDYPMRSISNDNSAPSVAIASSDADGYVANSLRNYYFLCRDVYGDVLSSITLTIKKDDSSVENFPAW